MKSLLRAVIIAASFAAVPELASAQAWVPTEMSLQLSVDYSFVFSSSDVFSEPVDIGGGEMSRFSENAKLNTHLFIPTIDFTPVGNLGLKMWLPMALSKCVDENDPPCPHRHPDPNDHVDDGKSRFTLQDFNLEARYMIDIEDVITLAPSLGGSVPTNDYPTVGHAIVGRGRPQIRAGLNVGRAMSELIPGMYFHGRYQFAYVLPLAKDAYDDTEKDTLKNISIHRSMVDFELGYFFFEDLAARLTIHWETTHGGVEYVDVIGNNGEIEVLLNHDVLGAERYFLGGIGISYILLDELFLSATFLKWIDGANTHDSDAFNFSVAYTIF